MTDPTESKAAKRDSDRHPEPADPPPKPKRRYKVTRVGKTAQMSVRRKVMFVFEAIKAGRQDTPTALACLEGPDAGAVRFGVWRRAQGNAVVALALSDEWKREAMEFGRMGKLKNEAGA